MAKGLLAPMNKDIQTVIVDRNGQPVLTSTYHEYTLYGPNGETTKKHIHENYELECGTIWNPTYSAPPNPLIQLVVCDSCRRPGRRLLFRPKPSFGLVSKDRAHVCVRCLRNLCPAHARRGQDGKWRCASCARWATIRGVFRWVFFES